MQMQPVVDLPGFIAPPKGALQSGPSESAASFSDVHDKIVAGNSKNAKRSDLPAKNPPADSPKQNEQADEEEGQTATAGAAAIPVQPAPASSENTETAPAAQSGQAQAITDTILAGINSAVSDVSLLTPQPEPRVGTAEFTTQPQEAITPEAVNLPGNQAAAAADLTAVADIAEVVDLTEAADLAPTPKTLTENKAARPHASEIPPGITIAQARAADPAQPALEKVALSKTAGHASAQEFAAHRGEGLHRGHAFAHGQEVLSTTAENPSVPPVVTEAVIKDNTVSLAMGKSFAELLGGQTTTQESRPPAPLHGKTDKSSPPPTPPETQVEQQESARNNQLSAGHEENTSGNSDPANSRLSEKELPAATPLKSFSQEIHTQNLTTSRPQPATSVSTGSVQLPSGTIVTDQQLVSQVVSQLSIAIRPHGEGNSIIINLHPEELGRLKLELEVHKDTVKAHLLAQTQQAQEILERHIPRLREALTQQGLRLDEIRIDVEAGLAGGSKGFQHESGGARSGLQPPTNPVAPGKPIDKTLLAKTEPAGWLSGQTGLSLRI